MALVCPGPTWSRTHLMQALGQCSDTWLLVGTVGKPGVPRQVHSHFFTDHTLLEGTGQLPGELLNRSLFSRPEGLSGPHKETALMAELQYSVILPPSLWVVPISASFWTTLQETRECRYLFEVLPSFPSDMYPELRLLDFIVVFYFSFLRSFRCTFHNVYTSLPFDGQCIGFPFLQILTSTCYFLSFW